jgi:hypothetical protein
MKKGMQSGCVTGIIYISQNNSGLQHPEHNYIFIHWLWSQFGLRWSENEECGGTRWTFISTFLIKMQMSKLNGLHATAMEYISYYQIPPIQTIL